MAMASDDSKKENKDVDESIGNLNSFMRNVTDLMERLDGIQKKMGPINFGVQETGLKGAIMKLFETCCPISRNLTDDQMWEEHKKIRSLLNDENIPKINNIDKVLHKPLKLELASELIQWCKAKGGKLDNIKLSGMQNETQDFQILAHNKLDATQDILELPESLVLSTSDLSKQEAISHLVSKDPVLSTMENVLLAYCLLIEFYKKEDSVYWSYIKSLPSSYDNVCYYSLEEMEMLKGSSSFRDALNIWKGCVRQYAYFHLKILDQSSSSVSEVKDVIDKLQLAEMFCFEDYKWAAATVLSRSISAESQKSALGYSLLLIPILDLCKHKDDIYELEYDAGQKSYKAKCSREINEGAEIFIFYGIKTNSSFVLNYGFFPENNIHNFIICHLPLDANDSNITAKRDLMKRVGLSEYCGFPIGITPGVWAGDLMAYMRIYASSNENISILQNNMTDEDIRKILYSTANKSHNHESRAVLEFQKIIVSKKETLDKKLERPEFKLESNQTFIKRTIIKLLQSECDLLEIILQDLKTQNANLIL